MKSLKFPRSLAQAVVTDLCLNISLTEAKQWLLSSHCLKPTFVFQFCCINFRYLISSAKCLYLFVYTTASAYSVTAILYLMSCPNFLFHYFYAVTSCGIDLNKVLGM